MTIEEKEKLFLLEDDSDFAIALYFYFEEKCNYNLELLNPIEKKIFMCMLLENSGQADSILTFLQEEFSEYSNEVVEALKEINAVKSAQIIKKAIVLLPPDGSWFFHSCDEVSEKLMRQYDSEFSDYPDGFMSNLYRKYAELHKDKIGNNN